VTASDPESLATSRRQTAFSDLAIAVELIRISIQP
jgi:hypothetical protein